MRGPDPKATERARALRLQHTDAEAELWKELRGRGLNGAKFIRQAPVGPYVADFLCRKKKLIVELDGAQHDGSSHDKRRDRWLVEQGYVVLRFWNADVFTEREAVLYTILAALEGELEPQIAADMKFKAPR